jgi:hypothetical protein
VGLSRSISDDLLEYRGPAITTAFSLALGSAA